MGADEAPYGRADEDDLGGGSAGEESSNASLYDGSCEFPQVMPKAFDALLSWDEAYVLAQSTLKKMTAEEKFLLLRGADWNHGGLRRWSYVGGLAAIPRLGLSGIKMQDGAAGFQTFWPEMVGTATQWPSLLALAATWDPKLVLVFGVSLATEFRGKGADAVLGPSVNVHRVGRGGRNCEFMSGEDPYLGARLAEAYVRGVQSQGVITVVKHWVFNEQETNRDSESSEVDEKTAWELYYPPFQAAVDAGASAFMCSSNKINGDHACASNEQLVNILRRRMGFRGFVQSDLRANFRQSSGTNGRDQDTLEPQRQWIVDGALERKNGANDDAVTRVLAVMHRMNLSDTSRENCIPPDCEDELLRDVTSEGHAQLARVIAADSIVMLKNRANLLPLSAESVGSIVVFGNPALARNYVPIGDQPWTAQGDAKWADEDLHFGRSSPRVLSAAATPLEGISQRASAEGVRVAFSKAATKSEAEATAARADVAVVLATATSSEGVDRPNLSLEGGVDELIETVARHAKKTIVLVQAPGAVLMPWRALVDGILIMFLGGQETGNAWAEVLFGDRVPSGRLPITIPASEEDSIPPNGSPIVSYAEGLETGYRNKKFKAAFPFGHGLSYVNFTYLPPTTSPCTTADGGVHAGWGRDAAATSAFCVRVAVINDGKVASRTVAQLYVELPPVAGHPAPLLKGFWKTGVIEPGGLENVTFRLFRHDLSYYDGRAGRWIKSDSAVVHVGESSSDIRHSVPIVIKVGLLDFIFLAVVPPSGSMLPPGLAGRCFAAGFLACLLVSSYRLVQLVAFCPKSTGYTYLSGVDQCKGCEEDARMMAVEVSSQSQLETATEDSLNGSFYEGDSLDRYLEHSQRRRERMQQMQQRQSEKSRRQEQAHLGLLAQRREDTQWRLQEQRAVTNVRRAIGNLRPATLRNLGQLQDELKLAIHQNLEECGARRELVLEEVCQALAQARTRCGLEGLPADFDKFKPPQQA